MKCKRIERTVVMIACVLATGWQASTVQAAETDAVLTHDVFFVLADDAPETQAKLIAACHKYLTGHPGTIWFSAGPRAKEMAGEVNDRDFDVALHLVFQNKAALDAYGKSERHDQFLAEAKSLWSTVRVFDSYATASSHEGIVAEGAAQSSHKAAVPEAATGFAGMIRGKVVHKLLDQGLVVQVSAVVKSWEHSKAKDANSLVDTTLVVKVAAGNENTAKFIRLVHEGEEVTLDVAHKEGVALTLLELTEDQRERVKAVQK
jgi:hypothetical protein